MPRCADACPTGAHSVRRRSRYGCYDGRRRDAAPRVRPEDQGRLQGLPKKFIAGTVYDPDALEVVIGATCTLTGEGETFTQETNHWGDFWFDGLKDGMYSLKIECGWQDQDHRRYQHREGCRPGRHRTGIVL